MSGIRRFASAAFALALRAVIIVSLAGYSLSAVNAAMHLELPLSSQDVDVDHSMSHGGGDAAMDDTVASDDGHDHAGSGGSDKQCCQDYCSVAAIDCNVQAADHRRVEIVRVIVDDADSSGLAPRLHLPPNI
jgi:hypothetical protein